jgi:hypothetical protein
MHGLFIKNIFLFNNGSTNPENNIRPDQLIAANSLETFS